VGAYDGTQSNRPPTRFTSRGPTADGRQKPEIAAPGYRIRAARSMPRNGWQGDEPRLCVKSGTSMAAPWVSGTVALMMVAAGIERVVAGAADPHPGPVGRSSTQLGYGYLNTAAAVAAARRMGALPAPPSPPVAGAPRPQAPAPQPQALVTPRREDVEVPLGGWAPVWVEDAAMGAEADELALADSSEAAAEAHEPVIVIASGGVGGCGCGHAAEPAGTEDCGCGGRAQSTTTEAEPDDDEAFAAEDEQEDGEAVVPFGALGGPSGAPFEWEDVRDALAGLEGSGV
jgi:hypothetical protein